MNIPLALAYDACALICGVHGVATWRNVLPPCFAQVIESTFTGRAVTRRTRIQNATRDVRAIPCYPLLGFYWTGGWMLLSFFQIESR